MTMKLTLLAIEVILRSENEYLSYVALASGDFDVASISVSEKILRTKLFKIPNKLLHAK